MNGWRGRCLDLFARAEWAVTETLLALAAADKAGTSIKVPHLTGPRYDALYKAVGPGGPFAGAGVKAAEALASFRKHDSLRCSLAHGTFKVTLDRYGGWHLGVRAWAVRSGQPVIDYFLADEKEARGIADKVERDASRLSAHLRTFREVVRKAGDIPLKP